MAALPAGKRGARVVLAILIWQRLGRFRTLVRLHAGERRRLLACSRHGPRLVINRSFQAMQNDASASTESPRTLRRWSFTRHAWCDSDLPGPLIESVLKGDVDRVLFSSIPLQVKDRCVVGRYECACGSLLVKRHTWGGVSRTLRMAFREPAARSCARLGLYLHSRGIPTPRPRATVNCRLGPWTYRSYIISDYVEGTSLYRYIRFGSQSEAELRLVARQVARIWQQLVELGVNHNDMKLENFIVDADMNVWLIDLEKVRVGGKTQRQRQRQAFDVKNFLHVRGWHHRAEARAIFADAFLKTPYRDWLQEAGVDRMVRDSNEGDTQIDADLSVLILCDGGIEMPLARQAIDSVQDIADEIVLVEPTEDGRLEVFKRVDTCDQKTPAQSAKKSAAKSSATPIVRCPWILVLQQDECVTPFLAKELQQRIADSRAGNAFCVPIERQYFGRSVARRRGDVEPIRLFRQSGQIPIVDRDDLSVTADPQRMVRLTGTIQKTACSTVASYIDMLNETTTRAAHCRMQQGERPRLGRAMLSACGLFFKSYFVSGGIRSGWVGLQISVFEALFRWIEEAKLFQLAAEFRAQESDDAGNEVSSLSLPTQISAPTPESWRAKAA